MDFIEVKSVNANCRRNTKLALNSPTLFYTFNRLMSKRQARLHWAGVWTKSQFSILIAKSIGGIFDPTNIKPDIEAIVVLIYELERKL